jgi:hypothetical protein
MGLLKASASDLGEHELRGIPAARRHWALELVG